MSNSCPNINSTAFMFKKSNVKLVCRKSSSSSSSCSKTVSCRCSSSTSKKCKSSCTPVCLCTSSTSSCPKTCSSSSCTKKCSTSSCTNKCSTSSCPNTCLTCSCPNTCSTSSCTNKCSSSTRSCFSSSTNLCKKKVSKCIMSLSRDDFISSTLAVATTEEEAWNLFRVNIYNYINAQFIISLSDCKSFNSVSAQLTKVKQNNCVVRLYFMYNFIPNPNCLIVPSYLVSGPNLPVLSCASTNTTDVNAPILVPIPNPGQLDLCTRTYHNLRFYVSNEYVFLPNFSTLNPNYSLC